MALYTKQPGSNETPDSGQGGNAVTGNTNTGHSNTTASASAPSSDTKTCRWFSIPGTAGQVTAVHLKADWAYSSASFTGGATNQFVISYSVNGGSSWTAALNASNVSGSSSGSIDVALTLPQDLTQIQIRDSVNANAAISGSAAITANVSNIRVECTVFDSVPIVMM